MYHLWQSIRDRMLAGLLLVLPAIITIWTLEVIYHYAMTLLIAPIGDLIIGILGRRWFQEYVPTWWFQYCLPLIVCLTLGVALYVLGWIARTRLKHWLDGLFHRLPLVQSIYRSVYEMVQSLGGDGANKSMQRVVLINFPNAEVKSLAFVTASLQEQATGREILGVCLLTGVMPPNGFTLFVPADEVIDVNWTSAQALQAIVSGGASNPGSIAFLPPQSMVKPSPPPAGGDEQRAAEPA